MDPLQILILLPGMSLSALLIGGGWWIQSRGYPDPVRRRYLLILALAAGVIQLCVIGLAAWLSPDGENRPSIPIEALLAPSLLAVFAIALINLRGLAGARRNELILVFLLGLALAGLLIGLRGESLGYIPFVLLGSLVLGITWLVGGRWDALAIGLGLLALGLLGPYNRRIAMGPAIVDPQWMRVVYYLLGFVPFMIVALSALLFTLGVKRLSARQPQDPDPGYRTWLPALLRLALSVLLLACLAYTILWGSIWDQTSDGLYGIFLSMFCSLISIAAGVLMALTLSGRQRLASLVFLIVVPLLLFQAFLLGWRFSNLEITAGRAARLQGALERFHAREQAYPADLNDLVPRDALWVPGPVILKGEGWCYQGGANYYRLGAFYRDFFSSPLSLKVYAAAGTPPATGWECQARLPEMKARYDWPP